MKTVKRLVCTALAVLLLVSLCVSFADAPAKQYKYYVSIGDSVAAGYTLPDYNSYYLHGYMNYHPYAYPNLIRQGLNIPEMFQGAVHGIRTTDARIFFEDDYYGDDYTRSFLPGWGPWTPEQLKAMAPDYQEAVRKADLLTLNVVNNDMMGQMVYLLNQFHAQRASDPNLIEKVRRDAISIANGAGGIGAAIAFLLQKIDDLDETVDSKLAEVQCASECVSRFKESWDKLCEDIFRLNPKLTVVAIGMYCPEATTDEHGELARIFLMEINDYMRSGSPYSDRYIFADVYGVTARNTDQTDKYGGGDHQHLDIFGHQQVARIVVDAVNAYDLKLPYIDVFKSNKYYNDIHYVYHEHIMSGVTDKLFMPDLLLTREQAAEAMYALAGWPAVSGSESFIDVSSDANSRNAIIWATQNGLMKSVTPHTFAPLAFVTKSQLANMLYKLSGSPEDVPGSVSVKMPFVPSKYLDSVKWAVDKSVISGCCDGFFHSQLCVSREYTAGVLADFCG